MEYIVIGQVVKAQGIKGEIKIKPLTDDPSRFKKLKSVIMADKPYKIESCRVDGFVYLKLEGVDDRNSAENLVGAEVNIDRVNSVPLEKGRYFVVDIIGCDIIDEDGITLGKVTDLDSFGAADVITAKTGNGRIFRFPFLNKLTSGVDVEKKIIRVLRKELDGVCVYED